MDLQAASDVLAVLADPTRVRLLALLAGAELPVSDLVAVLDVAQSRVSSHLARLKDAGLVRDRRAGTQVFYAAAQGGAPTAHEVWQHLAARLTDPQLKADQAALASLLKARSAGEDWPDAAAGQMERHYSPGRTWESLGQTLVGLVQLGDVLDAGGGDGTLAQMLAAQCRSMTVVDVNPRMLQAARRRLKGLANVSVEQASVTALPFAAARFDHVLMLHVLADVTDPAAALTEAARVLRPGGRISVATLAAHAHLTLTAPFGHRWPGFSPAALRRLLSRAGLQVQVCKVTSREKRHPHFEVITAQGLAPHVPSPKQGRSRHDAA